MDHRRSERITARVPFDVYCRTHRLGRFWTQDLSQEGLFLTGVSIESRNDAILELRFEAKGVEHSFRGIVVHHRRGQGVGIQLAYWRMDDRLAHLAYCQFTIPNHLSCAA